MKKFLVKVRLNSGSYEFVECDAETEFDAKQQVGWQYVRNGVVVHVYPVDLRETTTAIAEKFSVLQ